MVNVTVNIWRALFNVMVGLVGGKIALSYASFSSELATIYAVLGFILMNQLNPPLEHNKDKGQQLPKITKEQAL
jgi:hypothetical protein